MASRKRLPTFYRVYFGVILVVLMAIVVGMIWLTGLLSEYESAQPYNVADEVFEKYYLSGDFGTLADMTHDEKSFDTADAVAKQLSANCAKDTLSYTSVSSGDSNILKYIVKSGDVKISSFTLKKSGETTDRGFDLYVEDSFELYYTAEESVTVLVPENSQVFVNEKLLGEEYIRDADVVLAEEGTVPEGLIPPKYTRYSVDGLIEKPSLKVMTDGVENAPVYNEETKEYEASFISNAALEAEHKEFILSAVKEYAKYMQNDGRWGNVRPYFDPSTDLYDSVRTAEPQYVHPHTGYRFDEEYAGEFYAYDDNTFSCRVHVVQALEYYGMEDFTDKIELTVYLRKVGNKFLIFDWTIIGD